MIANVGFDLDVLEWAAVDPEHGWSHRQFVQLVIQSANLQFSSQAEVELFHAAIRDLPDSLRKTWEPLTVDLRKLVSHPSPELGESIRDAKSYDELVRLFAEHIEIAFVHSDRADELGVGPDDAGRDDGKLEVARFLAAAMSPRLRRVREVSTIAAGTARQEVFDRYLGPALCGCTHLTILDRFAGDQLIGHELHGDASGQGITWLLRKAHCSEAKKLYVVLIVWQKDYKTDKYVAAVERFAGRLGAGAIREIRLQVHRNVPHDRHLRLGDRVAVQLGSGVGIWSKPVARESYGFAPLDVEIAQLRERHETGEVLIDQSIPVTT